MDNYARYKYTIAVPSVLTYLFPLSYEDCGMFSGSQSSMVAARSIDDIQGDSVPWWLRTCYDSSIVPLYMKEDKSSLYDICEGDFGNTEWGIRPAFHLNLSSVFYIMTTEMSKMEDVSDVPVKSSGYHTWNLTLKDTEDTSFAATVPKECDSSNSIPINVTTVGEGSVEYNKTAAMLVDCRGAIVAYRVIGDASAGEKTFGILDDLPSGTYTLKVFPEQVNGDNKTDYAGQVVSSSIQVTNSYAFPQGEFHEWKQDFVISDLATVKLIHNGNEYSLANAGLSFVPTGEEHVYHLQGTCRGGSFCEFTLSYSDGDGNSQMTTVRFISGPQIITGIPAQKSVSPRDKSFYLTPKITDGNGDIIDIDDEAVMPVPSYNSSNEGVATVSSDGKVMIHGEGITTITVCSKKTLGYKTAIPVTCVLTVSDAVLEDSHEENTTITTKGEEQKAVPESINMAKTTISKVKKMTYTGRAKRPKVKLANQSGTLKKGREYTVAYKKNKEVGTAKIIITGKGNYTGKKTVTFQISKR